VRAAVTAGGEKLELEASPSSGEIPERVLDELVSAKTRAKDATASFGDAIKAQATKYKLKPAALRKYVTAREADKLNEARIEALQLADLIG
jgi:hypothetical protein